MDIVRRISHVQTDENEWPRVPVFISGCGEIILEEETDSIDDWMRLIKQLDDAREEERKADNDTEAELESKALSDFTDPKMKWLHELRLKMNEAWKANT